MNIESIKQIAITESEKYVHKNCFGSEKSKNQVSFLAGFEFYYRNNDFINRVELIKFMEFAIDLEDIPEYSTKELVVDKYLKQLTK
jgi:hypothetical protein|tara:strand:- start:213 stop:470 length:258 start_codon:yes stop_codon:yes gene_type:complete